MLSPRHLLRSVFAASLACVMTAAMAQWPSKPVRIIVPAAAGGPTDVVARAFAPALSQLLGQPVVIENRGGAGGIVGTEALAKAAPDGYTLGLVFISHATNPALRATLPYDSARDFKSIGLVARQPLVLVVNPSVQARTVSELVASARASPAPMAYAADPASAPHLAAELFRQSSGIALLHVPYKGNGPALTDVVAGQVPVMFNTINTCLPLVQAGRVRALAVTGTRRSALAPEIPTMAESGYPKVEVSAWYVVLAPAGVPAAVAARLEADLASAVQSPAVRQAFEAQGLEVGPFGAAAADEFLRAETRRWSEIIRTARISAD